MRSTISRSIAAVGVGAALTLVPVGIALADNHVPGVPNPIEEPFVDDSIGDDPEYNNEENWEYWLGELGFVGVSCEKTDYENEGPTYFEVPDYESEDAPWILAIVKAGADQSTDGMTNDLYWEPEPGELLEHNSGKNISHVILCSAEADHETTTTTTSSTTSTTSTTSTGPVVETDVPAGSDMSQVGLFAGVAAALAAAGALLFGRRRNSSQH